MTQAASLRERLSILGHFLAARKRRFRGRAQLEAWQARRMAAFRRELLAKLPGTRELAESPLDAFPIIDKTELQRRFAELNVLGLSHERALKIARGEADGGADMAGVTAGMSSGTSGNRGVFLVSAAERRMWLGVILAKALPDAIWRRHRVGLLLSANSRLYQTAGESGRLTFRFIDLAQGLDQAGAALERFQPTVLIGPAHVLGLLARRRLEGRLDVAPERVFSAAEVLWPLDEDAISAAWGRPVHQIYQCTEGFLGVTCERGTLHLNEDHVLFEKSWIDRERRAFNPVITDFSRRTQAMIRYKMNDVLIERAEPCPCGSPLLAIERIEGRCDDLLAVRRADDSGIALMFPDDLRAQVLDAAPAARDFRLVQPSLDRLQVSLDGDVPPEQFDAVRAALRRCAMHASGGGEPPEVEFTAFAPTGAITAKLRRVRRSFPLPVDI